MPSVTYNFLPEGGTLASGVREPSAMVKGGVATYINLDPDVSPDVAYEAAALPAASSPAWTRASFGTGAQSVSGGELTISCPANGDQNYYYMQRTGLVSTSPAYLRIRAKVTASDASGARGMFTRVEDSDKHYETSVFTDRAVAVVDLNALAGSGTDLDATSYHVYDICKINNTKLVVYIDGRYAFETKRARFGASGTGDYFWFGVFGPNGSTTAVITSVHLKDATLWPSTSPTADFVFDSGSSGTLWDMSTIAMVENVYGEAGNVKYKYGAGETTSPSLSGAFQTAAQLTSESDPTGRYLRVNVQLNGDGSQDAGWGGMQIAATTVKSGVSKSRVIGGV